MTCATMVYTVYCTPSLSLSLLCSCALLVLTLSFILHDYLTCSYTYEFTSDLARRLVTTPVFGRSSSQRNTRGVIAVAVMPLRCHILESSVYAHWFVSVLFLSFVICFACAF